MGAPGRSAPTPEWIRDPWRLDDGVRSIRLDPSLRGPEDLGISRRCLLRLPRADADAAGSGPPHREVRALADVRPSTFCDHRRAALPLWRRAGWGIHHR